jgi:peptidyl-prolyl cis-trans isomerase A (cyclophilin A)
MPRAVANFLVYVNGGRYDGSVVHRNSDTTLPSIRDFVIQGGGFFLQDPVPPGTTLTFSNVILEPPILDEPGGGVPGPSNVRGTIAMAKFGPDTVTSQWFINQGDNSFLDDPMRPDGGFSVFGEVLGDGMTVVDAIGDLPLPTDFGFAIGSPFNDLPLRNFNGNSIEDVRVANTVVVNSISVVPEPSTALLMGLGLVGLATWQRAPVWRKQPDGGRVWKGARAIARCAVYVATELA